MATGYPTSALALMAYDGAWADLAEGAASVTGFHVGRG
jgi:phosphohistidine phosphatase